MPNEPENKDVNRDRLLTLVEVWEEMISRSHRKSRDGYFAITKSWTAHDGIRYYAEHNGYIGGTLDGEYRSRYVDAEADLFVFVLALINDQYEWAKGVIDDGGKDEIEWNGDEAQHMIDVYERNSWIEGVQ